MKFWSRAMWEIVIFEAAGKDRDQGTRVACRRFISRLLLRAGVLAQFVAMWAGAHGAYAQNATWRTTPISGDFDTDANWSPATVPTGTATFGTSNITNISFSTVTLVGALQFSTGAPAYSFDVSTSDLEIDGTGIVNNSSDRPTLTNSASAGTFFQNTSTAGNVIVNNQSGGFTEFENSSTAGAAIITNNNSGSGTFFIDKSTAGSATITTNSGAFAEFFNSSTAGNATITTNSDGATTFSDSSTAGNATVITNSGGITEFFDSSTAGTATVITNSGGFTAFLNTATGGAARFITNAGGIFDISLLTSRGTTVGSIEGAGTYRLGSKMLTVGTNNFSTEVSGTIIDGGFGGGAGGSLIKVGTGTLTLSGADTYSGGTTISAGTLQLGNGGTTGSILGDVVDNATLAFDRSNTTTFGGVISGTGNLTQIGSGTTILTGNNTYTGRTIISAGTLQIGNGGTSGGIIGNVTDNGALVFDRSGAFAFSGSISGTGTVTQDGTGTLTLAGNNTYSGGTLLNAGTLAVNRDSNLGTGPLSFNGGALEALPAGGGIVSSKAIALNTQGGTFLSDTGTTSTLSGTISGAGSLTKKGAGTLTLDGTNTYSGGTILDSGTLIVNSAQALGIGNVRVNGGVLTADPQAINVQGNYFQGPNGTLQLRIAGANPGQFDFLNVSGNASLGGTLQLINQNFQPKAGDQLTLVKTGGIVTGAFSRFIDPFTTGSAFNTIDLVYSRQSVVLEFLNGPHPVVTINFASFAQTPNQLAAAKLLDAVELDPRTSNLIAFFLGRPFTNIPTDLNIFSPEPLSSFYEISFSAANIQRLTLENRLDEVRMASGSTTVSAGNGAIGLEKTAGDGKTSKNPVEPMIKPAPQLHFDLWAVGFGDFVKLDSDFNARGYQFAAGGFDLGFDYRFLDHFVIGVMGSYAHTWTDLRPGNITVNTGRGGLYASYFTGGSEARENYGTFYLDAGIYGGHNTYDSSRQGLGGNATGNTAGNEWSGFVSAGYDFHCRNLTIGPIASLQYTNVYISGFSETGSLAPLSIHSDSEESLRSDLGFRAFYQWHLGRLVLAPYLTASWEHEFKYSALHITAGFADIAGPNETFIGPAEGQDSAVLTAGLSVHWTPMISIYVGYDGQLGRGRYSSNAVTGGVRVSW